MLVRLLKLLIAPGCWQCSLVCFSLHCLPILDQRQQHKSQKPWKCEQGHRANCCCLQSMHSVHSMHFMLASKYCAPGDVHKALEAVAPSGEGHPMAPKGFQHAADNLRVACHQQTCTKLTLCMFMDLRQAGQGSSQPVLPCGSQRLLGGLTDTLAGSACFCLKGA